jgi:hypothetical protein
MLGRRAVGNCATRNNPRIIPTGTESNPAQGSSAGTPVRDAISNCGEGANRLVICCISFRRAREADFLWKSAERTSSVRLMWRDSPPKRSSESKERRFFRH